MSLIKVARRLRNETIARAVEPFTERKASLRRVGLLAVALVWAASWRGVTGNPVLSGEAAAVLPWLVVMLGISIAWTTIVRLPRMAGEEWVDAVGTVGDFAGLAMMLSVAFNLLLPCVVFLPLICITTGARYNRTAFWAGIVSAVVILGASAPDGYWASRPVVAVLAVALIVGMPMTVNRLLTSLREISEQAIHARDTQTRFLAVMSHELRTPLSSIVNATGLIDKERLPRDQRPLLNLVTTNAAVLMSRVDDVLDVAAIDGGTFQLNVAPFELRAMLQTVRSVVQSMLQAKDVTFEVAVEESVQQVLIGDARRIEQVICNLTSNAVKYTPRGGDVRIDIRVEESGAREYADLIIAVSDTGIGIPDAHKAKIFDAFHQVSQGDARAHDGVGLGLHIVRTVSDRMGGHLSVSNRLGPLGGGSIFRWKLRLPVAGPGLRVTETLEMLEMIKRHRLAAAPRSCLVIDDNPSNLDIMRRILVLGGHQVLTAVGGEEALKLLRTTPIDVAFLDLHMPGMSGWDVLEEHRQGRGGSQATKIVILSAVTDAESRERAMSMGVAGYLRKPMMTKELLDVLVATGPSGPSGSLVNGEAHAKEENHIDVMRSIASQSDVAAYLHACVDELTSTMSDIAAAHREGNSGAIFEQAHRLKNVFMNGSFEREAELCSGLMRAARDNLDPAETIATLAELTANAVASLKREPEYNAVPDGQA